MSEKKPKHLAAQHLSEAEKTDTIRSIVGLVRRLNGTELPDSFDFSINVRRRVVRRTSIAPATDELIVQTVDAVYIKKTV